jgi:hypothetical protein
MRKVEKKTFVCVVCGKHFLYYDKPNRVPKYCSKECWGRRSPKVLNACLYCGKEHWVRMYKIKNGGRIYCSHKCSTFHKQELLSGENSRWWRGGKTALAKLERTRAKYTKWRTAVFVRDGYACQRCGLRSGYRAKVFLHAHHIQPFSQEINLRYEITNGLTLCKNCHLLEHRHKF